jgi:hypothetical protein
MFNGTTKNVEDVVIGDSIMGDDSTQRNVLELCSDIDEMFKVIPKKGNEYYTVNKLHKLVLIDDKSIITEITVEDYINKNKFFKKNNKIFKTSVNFSEFTDIDISIDPYKLGLCIGKKDFLCKNIPLEYKTNTRENRLKLISGLLDSDGSYEDNIGYEYIQENEILFDDVLYVARSLGFNCFKKKVRKSINDQERIFYKCFIYGNINEIKCKILKKENCNERSLDNSLCSNFKVESIGQGRYFGFILDGNHRFLLGSFDVVRNTGKTTLITSILYEKKHIFPVGMVMSGTEDSNGFYRKVFPSSFVYNKYNEDTITNFIRRQKIAKVHLSNPWAVILLDDCTDDPSLFKKPLQASMYKNGRHWKMLYILSLQYCMDVRPAIRTNIDGTFILREPNLKNRKALYENYAGIIPDFHLFCELLDTLTNDYTALYIHNASTSNNWQECIYYYRAGAVPDNFKFGSPEFWEFHHSRYNNDYTDPVI